MPERPVTVRIESYSVALGAFASLDPARAPSQNVQITLTAAPDQGVKTALHPKTDQEPLGEGPVNADGSPRRA
jgi:hypothetical protein